MSQKIVSKNIEDRGYYNTFTPAQLLARHIAKLQEELSEAAVTLMHKEFTVWPFDIHHRVLGGIARDNFDSGDWQEYKLPEEFDLIALMKELADVQVVLLSMAELINEHFARFDVVVAAVEKSAADINRGVR